MQSMRYQYRHDSCVSVYTGSIRRRRESADARGSMHSQTIFTKTPKGVQELEKRALRLSRYLGLVFLAVDGRRSVAELRQKAEIDEASLVKALNWLVADGYVKVFYQPPEARQTSSASADFDLDFTKPAGQRSSIEKPRSSEVVKR